MKNRLTIYLDDDTLKRLETLATQQSCDKSSVIANMINAVPSDANSELLAFKKSLIKFIGINSVENFDEIGLNFSEFFDVPEIGENQNCFYFTIKSLKKITGLNITEKFLKSINASIGRNKIDFQGNKNDKAYYLRIKNLELIRLK